MVRISRLTFLILALFLALTACGPAAATVELGVVYRSPT